MLKLGFISKLREYSTMKRIYFSNYYKLTLARSPSKANAL